MLDLIIAIFYVVFRRESKIEQLEFERTIYHKIADDLSKATPDTTSKIQRKSYVKMTVKYYRKCNSTLQQLIYIYKARILFNNLKCMFSRK